MSEIALYRKYRPHNFDNLVGQDHIKTTLTNAIKGDNISHAYLFTGPRGTGKTSTARLVAKALNCVDLQNEFEPCDKCELCNDINEGRLIDIIEIDAASNRGIDEVRDLKEKIQFAPTRSKYKVYIIDEAHMMTKEAFNALLKTLEEPPSHTYFILATTEVHKIPETIISRCQRFDFKRISDKAIMTRLSYIAQLENISVEDRALEAISKYVDGGLRDAIGMLEQLVVNNELKFEHIQEILGISDYTLLENLYNSLVKKDVKNALKAIHILHDQGSDLKQFVHEFLDLLRNKLLLSVAKEDNNSSAFLIYVIETFQEANKKIGIVSIPHLPLEIAVIQIAGELKNTEHPDSPAETPNVLGSNSAEKSNTPQPQKKTVSPDLSKKDTPSVPTDLDSKFAFDIESLKKNWPRITERVKSPSLRMSLRNSIPFKLDGTDLTLQFNTNFHRDKVMEHEHRIELENIILNLSSHPAKILSVVKELEIMPVMEEDRKGEIIPGEIVPGENPSDNNNVVVSEALNIFGGEIVN